MAANLLLQHQTERMEQLAHLGLAEPDQLLTAHLRQQEQALDQGVVPEDLRQQRRQQQVARRQQQIQDAEPVAETEQQDLQVLDLQEQALSEHVAFFTLEKELNMIRGSFVSKRYFDKIMRGWDNSLTSQQKAEALDAHYNNGKKLASFDSLIGIEWVLSDFMSNYIALEFVCKSSNFLAFLLNIDVCREYITTGSLFYTYLDLNINQSDTFIKKDTFNSDGTWTFPTASGIYDNGINAIQMVGVGPAGTSASGSGGRSGGSGGGGQFKARHFSELEFPSSSLAVTIPSAGSVSSTTIGSDLSCAGGENGTNSSPAAIGGGTTSNSNAFALQDIDAPWHFGTFSIKGGDGALYRSVTDGTGLDGSPGALGSGGNGVGASSSAPSGTGIGSSGASGGGTTTSATPAIGSSATENTGCSAGGGAFSSINGGSASGTSAKGTARVIYVRKRAF